MSRETLQFLYELLCAQNVQVGGIDFENVAMRAIKAKAELITSLEEAGTSD